MERSVALKRIRALLGKSVGYRINDKAATREERELAKAEIPAFAIERDRLKKDLDARYNAILAADQDYQLLRAAHKAAKDNVDRRFSLQNSFKFTVGTTVGNLFFNIKAQGDSWEDVIRQLQCKK